MEQVQIGKFQLIAELLLRIMIASSPPVWGNTQDSTAGSRANRERHPEAAAQPRRRGGFGAEAARRASRGA